MTPEEYTKFIEEVKKGIFALKKVIFYANRVQERALEIGQLDDRNIIFLSLSYTVNS